MGPPPKTSPQNGLFWNRLFGCFVICLQCLLLHSAWPSCSLQPQLAINWQFEELIVHVTHYFKFPSKLHRTQLVVAEKVFLAMFFPTFCASNRAPDGSFCVPFFCPGVQELAKEHISFGRPRYLAAGWTNRKSVLHMLHVYLLYMFATFFVQLFVV